MTLKTQGRPQEIIEGIVERNEREHTHETICPIFLAWLWHDFRQLQAENASLRGRARDALLAVREQAEAIADDYPEVNAADRIVDADWPEGAREFIEDASG